MLDGMESFILAAEKLAADEDAREAAAPDKGKP